jgi:histidine ammonia-lyase
MTAASKLRSVVDLAEMVTAIELMTAAQALEFRKPLTPGRGVKSAFDIVRRIIPPVDRDRSTTKDIELIVEAIHRGDFDALLN